jgi:uncharacterized membrane protein
MAKIYYAGYPTGMMSPGFAATPAVYSPEEPEPLDGGRFLKEVFSNRGWNKVESISASDFRNLRPGEYEQVLAEFDVLIFSNIEAKHFQYAPSFFEREKIGSSILTFPDRVRLTVEAIKAGKGVIFLGGRLSFTGEMGQAGWGRTPLREVLPIKCLDYEDLVESSEGFTAILTGEVKATVPANPFASLGLNSFPPILGYHKTKPREGCPVLISVQETGHPLVAAGQFGRGRTLAFTSDPASHWGINFIYWEHFADFWLRCLKLVLPESSGLFG